LDSRRTIEVHPHSRRDVKTEKKLTGLRLHPRSHAYNHAEELPQRNSTDHRAMGCGKSD
jgi:hypothetical protein